MKNKEYELEAVYVICRTASVLSLFQLGANLSLESGRYSDRQPK